MAKDDTSSPDDAKPEEAPAPTIENEAPKPTELLEAKASKRSPLKRFWRWASTHKKLSIPLVALLLLAIILAIPATRYQILGLFIKKSFSVTVLDSKTGKAVSGAQVSLAGASASTNAEGKTTLDNLKPGNHELKVTKRYYRDGAEHVLVSLSDDKNTKEMRLQATGRQVPVSVMNKITGSAIAGATIATDDTKTETNDKGEATMVVGADEDTVKVTISAKGFNDAKAVLSVNEEARDQNTFKITPVGKVYFLSKRSGRVDVVKSNLDGTGRRTVAPGTGQEIDSETVLLATRDWKFLALKSRRDGGKSKLYMLDTSNDKMVVMDEGNATFDLVGWKDHHFVYKVNREGKQPWQAGHYAIKSYNADTKTITTMLDSKARGTHRNSYAHEVFQDVSVVGDEVVFASTWVWCCYANNTRDAVRVVSAKVGTKEVTTIRSWSANRVGNLAIRSFAYNELYVAAYDIKAEAYGLYEYEDGSLKATGQINTETFFTRSYPRYILSPSGGRVFWAETRDGKKTLFMGDKNATNETVIASGSEFTPYGWYSDDYLLVSKEASELYIMANKKGADKKAVKVTDYHRSDFNAVGHGGGY